MHQEQAAGGIDVTCLDGGFAPPADTGEPLGPEAEVFHRLRCFRGKVKGALAVSVVRSFEDRHPALADRVAAELSPAYRRMLDDGLLGSSWYPECLFCSVLRSQRRLRPPASVAEEVRDARRVFERMSRSFHSLFFRMAGPRRLLGAVSRLWRLYHTIGTARVEEKQAGQASGVLTDNPAILEPGYAEGTIGAIWGALVLSGARDVHVAFSRRSPDTLWMEYRWRR